MEWEARKALVAERFRELFGGEPALWVRAPGRVDLMGSHTDYNLGFVMTMSLDRDTWLALRPRNDGRVNIHSMNLEGSGEFSLEDYGHDECCVWTDYVRGMAWALQQAGHRLAGFEGLVHSTIPFGSGLSSSAAIEMAAGLAFAAVSKLEIEPVEMARLGQRAENGFVGVNSGILDQYSSALGRAGTALLLDCRDLTSQPVPLAGGMQVVVCDTRAPRSLAGTEYGERRAQCEEGVRLLQAYYPDIKSLRDVSLEMFLAHARDLPEVVARRCRFVIDENNRVLTLAEALPRGDREGLRYLMQASYFGARDLYEIGAPSMAAMMEAMMNAPGVIGSRQAGAGFGGCMVALVEDRGVDAFAVAVRTRYLAETGIEPAVYPVWAGAGAGLMDV
jgi:galactokinase